MGAAATSSATEAMGLLEFLNLRTKLTEIEVRVDGHPPRNIKAAFNGKTYLVDEWGKVRGLNRENLQFKPEEYDEAGGKPRPSATADSSGFVKLTVSRREDYSWDFIEHLIQAELQSNKWAFKGTDAVCVVPDGGEWATVKVISFKGEAYDADGQMDPMARGGYRKMRPDLRKHHPKFHIKDFGVGPGGGFIAVLEVEKQK